MDIDPQAVEVTKLSLLLKVLEGETGESLVRQLRMFHERALPDLGNNIKCGNSLIGPAFYGEQQMSYLGDVEQYRINAFDWRSAFPQTFSGDDPGFDAVIGNPPYIRIQALKEWAPVEVEYYKRAYQAARQGNYDIYVVFVERGLQLLNHRGRLGYILPHKFFNAQYGRPLRSMLSEGQHLAGVVHFGDEQVFGGATTYTTLMFLEKGGSKEVHVVKVDDLTGWRATGEAQEGTVPASTLTPDEWNFTIGSGAALFEKLRARPVKLADVTAMFVGLQTSADTVYLFKSYRPGNTEAAVQVLSQELGEWVELERHILKPVVRSGSVHRYTAVPTALALFPYEVHESTASLYSQSELRHQFPLAWAYLVRNKKLLEGREKGKFKDSQWYRYGRTQNLGMWEQPKLLVPYMITRLSAYLDTRDNYYFINVTTGGYGLTCDESRVSLPYLCGLLNSRLLDFYLTRVSTQFHGGYFAANKQYIEQLPIRTINFSDAKDRARHDQMVTLVERMLELHRRAAEARTGHDRELLQRQIARTDQQIDRLVYELYELTDGEIAVVEERSFTG